MSRRTDRVADVLRQEISVVLLRRLSDPRIKLVTVSAVDVSPDLKHAKVMVSVLGDDAAQETCLQALDRASGFIRSEIARSLRHLRSMPDLVFELDRGAEYSERIEELLESSS